ncbi:MAG: nucleotidyltransferase family protein [Alphaproteobacteria bacterium]|nr:nucleotidyltransferase family protein [Alphaproteobacteria bacterium]
MIREPLHAELTLSLLRAFPRSGIAPLPLADVSWHRLVAFASSHFVLQALAEPLSVSNAEGSAALEARQFISAIHDANADRNAMLLRATHAITVALGEIDVAPCALKGAAFLLTSRKNAPPAPWRFMSDIDLLVPVDRLPDCVAALGRLGYLPSSEDYDPQVEAHFPPLISPCRTFSVELHTRLFGLEDFGLTPAAVLGDATLVPVGKAGIFVPSLCHRIAHLLVHAQLHNRNHAIHRIVLKDVLDLIELNRECAGRIDWNAVFSGFGRRDQREAVAALVAAWQQVTGKDSGVDLPPSAQAWAARAIPRLHWPRWRARLNLPGDIFRMEAHRLQTERGHLRRRLKLLINPLHARDVYSNWSGKLRQRAWG